MVDFLFVYEVKNRELENILLLKCELERRGYSVRLSEVWKRNHYFVPQIKAKVVIGFCGYNEPMISFILSFSKQSKKYVDMQWEQVFSVYEEDKPDSAHSFTGLAREVTHLCWGKYSFDRLHNEYGIKERNLPIVGHISLDFLKPKFQGYYLSKNDIISKYGLPTNFLCLFISGFNLSTTPIKVFNNADLGFDPESMQQFYIKSQQETVEWFKKAALKYPHVTFIYRPHPTEIESESLSKLTKRCNNFKVIRELSVKQWILCSDKIYVWNSTSVAEVYAAKRICSILRPFPIPEKNDIRFFIDSKKVDSFNAFIDDCYTVDTSFPFNIESLDKYYIFDDNYTYIKICDKLVEILQNDEYDVLFPKYEWRFSLKCYFYNVRNRIIAKGLINKNRFITWLCSLKDTWKVTSQFEAFIEESYSFHHSTKKERRTIEKKIKKYL